MSPEDEPTSLFEDLARVRKAWRALVHAVWAQRISLFIWLGFVWVLMLVVFVAFRLIV